MTRAHSAASMIRLDQAANDRIYKFQKVHEDPKLRRQLASLGFVTGVALKVIRSQGSGPLLVEIKNARMAIGRAEAVKILLKES